jgi:hypothetical protein
MTINKEVEQLRIAHLGFIQGAINRMASNSFLLKGWTITIFTALFAFAAKDTKVEFVYICYPPVFIFWWLDAFFLYQERLFRKLYDQVAQDANYIPNYSMSRAHFEKVGSLSFLSSLLSKTLLGFYLPILFVLVAVNIIIKFL